MAATAEAGRTDSGGRTNSGGSTGTGRGPVARLGLAPGQVVLEIGYDNDCDEDLRAAIEDLTGSELVHESASVTSYYSSGESGDAGSDPDPDSDPDVDPDLGTDADGDTGHDHDADGGEDAVDVVLLWWRDEDGDLVDALVDALVSVVSGGTIWLLTPKIGRAGYVDPADIADAAPTAGLAATSTLSVSADWSGSRLVAPKARR